MSDFYPQATWRPGPQGKVWGDVNTLAGVICHSMQGSMAGAYSVLDDESLNHDAYRAASWHFSVTQGGQVFQHYPLTAAPFHAGSHIANKMLVGIEHEGGGPGNLSEPLTAAQINASVALVRWIGEQAGWPPTRDPLNERRLFEHNEWTQTVCPSGRIPWGYYVGVAAPVQIIPTPPRNAEFVLPDANTASASEQTQMQQAEGDVQARPLSADETLAVNEAVYHEFTDIQVDQRGGGMYEVSGAMPWVNGQPIPIPANGHVYLTVVPAPKGT